MVDFTWQPGKPGEPTANISDPKAMASEEEKTRTFHPRPDGFGAEKDAVLAKLLRRSWQEQLAERAFQIVVVGDISALGDHCGFDSETRYGFIPYLNTILNRPANFGGKEMHYGFRGDNNCGYSGDKGHEIWPELKTIGQIAATALRSRFLHTDQWPFGTVVPLMVGSKDIMNGRSLDDMKADLNKFLQELWKINPTAVVLLGTVPMHGDPDDKGDEFWPKQKKIIEWNAYLANITNFYSTTESRSIVKVHLTSPQKERIHLNVFIPSQRGYERIAHDFFGGILQAMQRGFFRDSLFDISNFEKPIDTDNKTYELDEVKDDVIGKINCIQPRGPESPSEDDILKSLFRGASDEVDFVASRACNVTYNCKFSWDVEVSIAYTSELASSETDTTLQQLNPDAEYPFSNGTTCIMAGGDTPRNTTNHQLLVQKTKDDKELGDWCLLAVSVSNETQIKAPRFSPMQN